MTSFGAGIEMRRCSGTSVSSKPWSLSACASCSNARVSAAIDVDPLLADLGLELAGRAGGDLTAVIDQDDAVGQRIGLLEVLGGQQQRDALGDQLADRRPDDLAAARVKAGGRLVEHQQLRLLDQAGGEVDAAPLAAGELLDQPARELGGIEALESARRALAAAACALEPRSRAISMRFSRAVRFGSSAANWPVSEIVRRTARASLTTSWPLTLALPPSGRSSVASMRTVVVLPAPLGPSSENDGAFGTWRSRSSTAMKSPKRLVRPCRLDCKIVHGAEYYSRCKNSATANFAVSFVV